MDKPLLRSNIRKWSMGAAFAIVGVVATNTIGAFIQAYGQEKGWFAHPQEKVAAVISYLHAVVASDWFQILGGIIVGFALGVRLDALLKTQPRAAEPGLTPSEMKVRYPHTSLFALFDAGMRRETDYTKENYRNVVIDIPLMFDGKFHVDKLVIEDCVLAGPAVVSFNNSNSFDCNFLSELNHEEIFVEITDERAKFLITCAYQFVGCTIRRCKFYRCAFVGSRNTLAPLRAALGKTG